MTALMVDQMAALDLSLADRAYVLASGRVVAQGRRDLPRYAGCAIILRGGGNNGWEEPTAGADEG